MPHLKPLRAFWRLLLVFVAMSFVVSGLNCEVELLEEQDEEMLVVQVFDCTNKNESIPMEGARVKVCPSTKELKDSGLSYWEREEAEAAFYQRGVTDENGIVVFNLSRSLYYFNTSIYDVYVSVSYGGKGRLIDVTETKEVSIFFEKQPEGIWVLSWLANCLFSKPLFLLSLTAAVVTIGTVFAGHIHKKTKKKKCVDNLE